MYKVIIELKKDLSGELLKQLTEIINAAFDNRGGKVLDSDTDSLYRFEFFGEESMFCCLQLGLLNLGEQELFMQNVDVWEWHDDYEPEESANLKEIYSKPRKW